MRLTPLQNRLDLAKAYFSPTRDFPISWATVAAGVGRRRCTRLGRRFISDISEQGSHLVVHLRSLKSPLYWPKEYPLFDLYKVITEAFCEDDWHFYEVPETHVEYGDVVLDCGAAEGIFALRVQARAARIVAFEPLPRFVTSMRHTFANDPKVSVVPQALGSSEGEALLAGDSLYGCVVDRGQGTPIRITTIDRWAQETGSRIDFIKGDLESFEMDVLRGAAETIRKYQPKIAFTVYHSGNNWREMLSYVRNLVPSYKYRIKGISYNGAKTRPVMLHLWAE